MIAAADLARRLADLEPIGLDERGTTRLAWTRRGRGRAARGSRAAPAEVGLRVEIDPAGNRWALPDAPAPWWGVGSHLDSVRAGRALRRRARRVRRASRCAEHAPVAVIAFADEEGARFNTPTFGSRALAGVLDPAVLERRDDDGVRLADAMAAAGVDPGRRGRGAGVARAAAGLPRAARRPDARPRALRRSCARLAARMRVQADLHGRADHAGTTRRHERSDALLRARDPHRRRPPARHRRHGRHRLADPRRAQRADDDRRARAPVARRALGEPRGAHRLARRTCPRAPS